MEAVDTSLYEQTSFRQAAGCEFRPGGMELTHELAAACALEAGERVLDLGCGVGSTACYLSRAFGADVVGLDASPEFLAEARHSDETVHWVLGRADAIPFPDARFDLVFAECFLSAFADPGAILKEVRRVLRPGGLLAVSDMYLREPGEPLPASRAAGAACLIGARGKDETLAVFRRAGFGTRLWKDRSETLKVLMASLIMTYGSAAAFWQAAVNCAAGSCEGAIGTGSSVGIGDATAADRAGCSGEDGGRDGASPTRESVAGDRQDPASWGAAMAAARPGYYLLVAESLPSAHRPSPEVGHD